MRRSGGKTALRSTVRFCTSMAQRTASTTMMLPSPVRLTMRPWRTAIIGSIRSLGSARGAQRPLLVGVGKAAVSDDIGRQFAFAITRDDARRFAADIAKLPELFANSTVPTPWYGAETKRVRASRFADRRVWAGLRTEGRANGEI